jgi:hypothetical protein
MGLRLFCDSPGCEASTDASWLPSGRLLFPLPWCVMPGETLVVACCHQHIPGMPKLTRDINKPERGD